MTNSIGPYEVIRELGRGGMGVVYLATDTRLDRPVAIKALPAELASDSARLERFEREAKTLAQLNHPNLAGIHGVEEQDGARYLVLEYVEGESLADRLDRGPLPVDEAIEYAAQIAAGLEAAHNGGVIHRDLKPANVMITPDGQAKVLDFGLARTDDTASSPGGLDSPTMTMPRSQHSPTIAGAILGTAAYMSPEQARGRRIDKRTDIWSFGVVLYEMLVGSTPFHGETATDSIGAVLHKDLELSRLPERMPARVRRALERCLERDRSFRYRDIGDVRLELVRKDSLDERTEMVAPAISGVMAFAGVMLVAALAGVAAWWLKPVPVVHASELVHAVLSLPDDMEPDGWPQPDLSSDGDRLVIKVRVSNDRMLAVRDLGDPVARVIQGTEDAWNPALSPDGEWVMYRTGDAMYKRQVAGGPAIRLCDIDSMRGGVWANAAEIVFAPRNMGPLHRISAGGGEPEPMYEMADARRVSDRHPAMLPDGRGVLFHRCRGDSSEWESSRLMVLPAGESEPRELVAGVSHGRYADSGHLVYQRKDALFAAGFDLETLAFTTPERVVLEGLYTTFNSAPAMFDLSSDGTLVYFTGDELTQHKRIVEVGLDGEVTQLSSHVDAFDEIVPSDDGRFIVAEVNQVGDSDRVETIELGRDLVSPIGKQNSAGDFGPVLSPDGRWIAFTSDRDEQTGTRQVYRARVGSASPPELVLRTDRFVNVNDWSSDGRMLIVSFDQANNDDGIGVIRLDDSGDAISEEIETLIDWPDSQRDARLSPDDRWVLFVSHDAQAGRRVFVASVEDPSISVQVSVDEADFAAWAPDGRTVYFTTDRVRPILVSAVDFEETESGEPVVSSPREALTIDTIDDLESFYMNGEGTGFVLGEPVAAPGDRQDRAPRLVLNWSTELRVMVPVDGER